MTTAEPVREAARAYLPWVVLAPLRRRALDARRHLHRRDAHARHAQHDGGLGAVYVAAVLVLMPVLGNHGLWAALIISFVARGLTLWLRYPALEAEADRAAA
jgi:multidrug resistance protein, MATE family